MRHAGGWHRVADPVRHPADAVATLLPDNPVGDVLDKLRVGLLRCAAAACSVSSLQLLPLCADACACAVAAC